MAFLNLDNKGKHWKGSLAMTPVFGAPGKLPRLILTQVIRVSCQLQPHGSRNSPGGVGKWRHEKFPTYWKSSQAINWPLKSGQFEFVFKCPELEFIFFLLIDHILQLKGALCARLPEWSMQAWEDSDRFNWILLKMLSRPSFKFPPFKFSTAGLFNQIICSLSLLHAIPFGAPFEKNHFPRLHNLFCAICFFIGSFLLISLLWTSFYDFYFFGFYNNDFPLLEFILMNFL